MKSAGDTSSLVERSLQQLVKFLFLAFILALALTHTSKCLWINIPVALVAMAGLYWLSAQVEIRSRKRGRHGLHRGHGKASEEEDPGTPSYTPLTPPVPSSKTDNKWREQVGSSVVEHAWETLCGSIIQEFVYDAWYSMLTPDREFPREIRRILNTAFGELAGRARQLDVRKMLLGDICALFMDQLMLYRDTRDSILSGLDQDAWRVLPLEARERALQAELKADSNLHPALYPPAPADSTAILGHYKVLRHISEGMAAFLLERHDHAKPIMRSVARELLCTCVLRPLLGFFTPYTANKLMLQLLSEKVEKRPLGVEELAAAASVASTTEPFRPVQSDIEQRARQSAAAEDNHAATVRAAKQAQRERNAAALERSMTADTASYLSRDGTTRFAAASTPGDGRHPSPRKKERRNWSPGRRDKFKAPPSPMQPNKAAPSGDLPTASALLQRTNGATGTGTSGQLPRDGSDGSDGWEEVLQTGGGHASKQNHSSMQHMRSASVDAQRFSFAQDQEDAGEWLDDAVQRRRADGSAVYADSNFAPDPDLPEGPLPRAPERHCFIGQPRARVVAADLHSEGSKDVVLYKIRVADSSGEEWTVSRRFRNFETLHRALREHAAYRLRLPAKRIFSQQHSVAFVEERRQQLDAYLQSLLANPAVAGSKEAWEFLSAWSELYGLAEESGFLRSVSAKLQGANTSMRRAVGDMVEDFDSTRRKSFALLRVGGSGSSGGSGEGTRMVEFDLSASSNSDLPMMKRASRSFSRDLNKLKHLGRKNGASVQDATLQPPPFQAMQGSSANGNGERGVRMVRVSGPGDIINGAGQLFAAGARQIQGARSVLVQRQPQGPLDDSPPLGDTPLRSASSMSAACRPRHPPGGVPVEEFHGDVLHYSRPASIHSITPSDTPLSATPASSRGHSPPRIAVSGASPGAAMPSDRGAAASREQQQQQQQQQGLSIQSQLRQQRQPEQQAAQSVQSDGGSIHRGTRFRQESFQTSKFLELPSSSDPEEEGVVRFAPGSADAASSSGVTHPLWTPAKAPHPLLAEQSANDRPAGHSPSKPPHHPPPPSAAAAVPLPEKPPPDGSDAQPLLTEQQEQQPAKRASQGRGGDTGHISFGGIVQSPSVASVAANIEAVGPPTGLRVPDLLRDDSDLADWEEAAGISAPLYDIVDTLFELQSRGFFRRQVFGVARQVLSLVAGGAIDEWLLSNLRFMRQEHTLARVIHHLQSQLWPGGAWYTSLPEHKPPADKPQPRWIMAAEKFLAPDPEPPIDEDEIREAVWELLFKRSHPALVRVVGKQVYHSGMADLFEMLQSRTFMQQFGYGLLKIVLVNLFPELKLLFRKIERGALEPSSGGPAGVSTSKPQPPAAAEPAAASTSASKGGNPALGSSVSYPGASRGRGNGQPTSAKHFGGIKGSRQH